MVNFICFRHHIKNILFSFDCIYTPLNCSISCKSPQLKINGRINKNKLREGKSRTIFMRHHVEQCLFCMIVNSKCRDFWWFVFAACSHISLSDTHDLSWASWVSCRRTRSNKGSCQCRTPVFFFSVNKINFTCDYMKMNGSKFKKGKKKFQQTH